jgi:hydroxyacylglutathione hydrolase
MKIFTTVNPESITNIYFITDDDQKYGVLIDPGSFAHNVYHMVNQSGAEPKKILITHNDIDQTAGIPLIKRIWDIPIYAHNDKFGPYEANRVMNGTIIEEGDLEFKIIETPAHTYDSISILINNNLFVGDILEAGTLSSLDRSHLPSEFEMRIIEKYIFSLPDNTIIYPGRGPATTVEIERKFNPYFYSR